MLLVLIVVASRSASPADTNGLQLASQTQTVGLSDATANANVDLLDIGVKTAAVLGIAYASLMLLKRFGVGGSNPAASTPVLRVVGSVALAPNRSVHAIELPGGRTLLVGATPSSINLLGELNGS
jgi:flagellar biogenesis protein FliO